MQQNAVNATPADLVFVPLGGVGEIGMNMGLYGLRDGDASEWLMVDCGIAFAGQWEPGVDAILPDTRFIEAHRDALGGIVITHAHEDHYGALISLWPKLQAPVYATSFAAAMLAAKIEREGAEAIPVTLVAPGEHVTIGAFDVEFIPVAHSIPQACALGIKTPVGLVVHTGDWKIDAQPLVSAPTDEARFRQLGAQGVTALVCDSTNAPRAGASISEATIATNLHRLIAEAPKRVVATTFASNVARVRTIADAAQACGRRVVVLGSSLMRVSQIARELGLLEGLAPFLSDSDHRLKSLRDEEILILATGTQGEHRAAMARLARGEHPAFNLGVGDRVIFSSRPIPGNEKAVAFVINRLVDRGCEIITDAMEEVHVTGHARRDELAAMYAWTRPELVVPVHGEAFHLEQHRQFARGQDVGVATRIANGEMIRLAPFPGETVGMVEVGRMYRDGLVVVEPDNSGVSRRRRLARAGHVGLALTLSYRGALLSGPDIAVEGLPEFPGQNTSETIKTMVLGVLDGLPSGKRKDADTVREAVRRAVRNQLFRIWGKKPVCTVFVTMIKKGSS